MRKPPELEHVKYVKRGEIYYAYFNTGKKKPNGEPLRLPLPKPGSVNFFDSYAAMCAGRTKRAKSQYIVEKLCDDYQNSKEFEEKATGTQRAYAVQLRRTVEFLGEFPVNDLERADIQDILDTKQFSPATQNLFVATIGAMYKWARARGLTYLQPTKDIERRKTGERLAWPEDALYAALGSKIERVRLSTALMFYTGQRIGDVCNMKWSMIKDGKIKLTQQKTKKLLTIPLHSQLQAQLDSYGKRGINILVRDDGRPIRQGAIRDELKAFCASIGEPDLVPHGLRKNAVIALLQARCSVAETASITGQTFQIVEYYARQIDQELMADAAIIKLERTANGKTLGKMHPKNGGIA